MSDTFRIKGRDLASNTVIAAARRMRDGFDYSSKVGDRADLLDFMDRHHDCLAFVSDTFNTVLRHITISAVLGAFGRPYYHIPEHTLRRAAQILLTGLSHDPRESTIVRLKELLVAKGHMMHGGAMVLSFYKKTEWALSQFALGRQVNRIQEATTELFPLPEEQEVKHG